MNTVASSADNTDLDENFEDAADTTEHSNGPTKTETKLDRQSAIDHELFEEAPRTIEPTGPAIQKKDDSVQRSIPLDATQASGDQLKSPLLTAHRMSRGSIDDGKASDPTSARSVRSMADSIEHSDSKISPAKPLPRPSRFQGFSASLPSVPWGAPPKRPQDPRATSPQPPQTRKVTAPFAWLGRTTSAPKENHPPPLAERHMSEARRNTATSVSTVGSNSDLTLKTFDDNHDYSSSNPPARITLREQFKLLRMREEAGIGSSDEPERPQGGAIAGLIGSSTGVGIGIGSPQSVADDKMGTITSPIIPPQSQLPPPVSTTTVNPDLAPGMVSGASAAPADASAPIDWDFWQTVVNQGPQAVARTSSEELIGAIAHGIPQTIRGVIWQVLASSKNEDLEAMYHELKVRGTPLELPESSSHLSILNSGPNGTFRGKESIASSSSSIHSDGSTPATSANAGVTSPSLSHEPVDPINSAKLQSKLSAEKSKTSKIEAAALTKLEKMIKRDMGSRTSYAKYAVASGFQDGLFNVCKAYALFDEAVGYPQGMNFIIMPMLFVMPEEEAFCLLVRLMNKYHLREMFIQEMPGLHLHLYQFERLLEDLEPALYCHLNRRGVTPKLYATQWFLTLFAYRFPLQLVMRVYDMVLCEGLEGAVLKFGMAVIQRNVATLLSMDDMLTLTNFLKERLFDIYIDSTPSSKSILESGFFGSSGGADAEVYRADLIVQDACSVKLTSEMLGRYREEWEEKMKIDKARETELETLRSELITKTVKIRSLEERAEKSDSEHISIANELVRLKVENAELQDASESLQGQVEELRKVADSEAANVEEKLRAEMERVTARNAEVQNQNRHMEDQMAEMELELVATKMKYAEMNGQHEELKQKWSVVQRALE